jgi:HK97 family phage major capsid protein
MNKELRELLSQISAKKTEARTLASEGKLDEAEAVVAEIRELERKAEVIRATAAQEERETGPGRPASRENDDEQAEYRSAYLQFLRNRPLNSEQRELLERRAMSEGVPADGGLIVPQDIQTRINELQRQFVDLSQYVTVEPVTTLSGSRVLEVEAEYTPFVELTELEDIPETDNPKFKSLTYAVKDRGGILPISNSLLRDTDQNLIAYVSQWLAKKGVATNNSLIRTVLNKLTKTALADIKAIKKALNVTLDPAISLNSVVLTNQDGFNYLDSLLDGQNRPLLQPDPTQSTAKILFGRPVVYVANSFLPSETSAGSKAPLILGNLKQLIVLFSRQNMELRSTDVGGDAFKRNTTDLRAIKRDDIKTFDPKAAVFGQLTIPA